MELEKYQTATELLEKKAEYERILKELNNDENPVSQPIDFIFDLLAEENKDIPKGVKQDLANRFIASARALIQGHIQRIENEFEQL